MDTSEIESFDIELNDLKELALSEDEDADEDDGFSLNTSLIESFDEELESLEALISPDEEAPFEETLTEDGDLSLDPDSIDLGSIDTDSVDLSGTEPDNLDDLISEKDASQDGEPSDSLESFDFDLENLDGLEMSDDGAPKADSSGADSDFGLDADQIAALDLEAVDTDAQDLAGDDFMLNLNEVNSLDLEMSDIGSSAENTDLESDESVDDINFVLDSDQIESLDLELGSTDMPDASEEGTKNEKSEQKPVKADKRRADVLNLDLERPDLDEPLNIEDGVDLPILDELLAPAEVFDDTLVENALDLETDATSAGESESKGNDFDFLDKLGDAPPEDSLPILELDDFDNSVDEKEKEVESATAPVEDDTEEAFVLEKGEPEEQKEPEPVTKSIDKGGKAADVKAPMPPGRFQDMPKRRTSRPLLILLAIILLLGLLYGLNAKGIVKVPGLNNVNIPFLDNVLKNDSGKTVDAVGKAQIKTADIKGKFILNKKSGRLFVITGQALNQYDKPRGTIQVRGNVYAAGGKQVASQAALCGNLLPDAELTTKPVTELQSQLSNKAGIGGSGIPTVGPGKTVPFMIVFSGLPTDIEEFSIEVVGSTAS